VRHLAALGEAVDAWLEHQHQNDLSDMDREKYLLKQAEANQPAPEQPEPLAILYQLRRFATTYWGGGLANQPYLLTLELNTCIDAELEFERRTAINAKRLAEWFSEHGKSK